MIEGPLGRSPLQEIAVRSGAEIHLTAGRATIQRIPSDSEKTGTLAVGEWSGTRVLDLVGDDLPAIAARLGVDATPPGMATRLPGSSEIRWCRLTRDQARLLLPAPDERIIAPSTSPLSPLFPHTDTPTHLHTALSSPLSGCLHVTDFSSGLTTLAVIGPRATDLLARLIRLDLHPDVFPHGALAQTGSRGIPVFLLRWDRGGLTAYELTVGRDVAEYYWEALLHEGEDLGVTPVGAESLARLDQSNHGEQE